MTASTSGRETRMRTEVGLLATMTELKNRGVLIRVWRYTHYNTHILQHTNYNTHILQHTNYKTHLLQHTNYNTRITQTLQHTHILQYTHITTHKLQHTNYNTHITTYKLQHTYYNTHITTHITTYVVGPKSFRADQLFKVTEIKQLCCFST